MLRRLPLLLLGPATTLGADWPHYAGGPESTRTATPAVYEVNGRQFVVIAAAGGKWGEPSGGSCLAFALP